MIPTAFVVIAVGLWLIVSNIRLRAENKKLKTENRQLSVFADDAASRYLNFHE